MAVVQQINETTWINEFGGLVSNEGHATDEMMIKIREVSKWYGNFQVLTDEYSQDGCGGLQSLWPDRG